MKYVPLGTSGLSVSNICLGSMTWGFQNNQQDADQQINYALEQGINFIDTAEMYAIPPTPETFGTTETIIGDWLRRNPTRRKDFVLASKIVGSGLPWIREGSEITGQSVILAVDDSLKRLQTDHIDLYQLHWPNRAHPHFGKHWVGDIRFSHVNAAAHKAQMLDILTAIDTCVKAGKIGHFGLSDDTTWGIKTYLELAKTHDLAPVVSIQNEFNLLQTKDWPYLIEQCVHDNIAYLPWSPLARGILTGKYIDGARPKGSRLTYPQRNGEFRDTPSVNEATKAYCQLAKDLAIPPAHLALAWCKQVDGVTSTIIGATNMEQLKEDIAAFSIELSQEAINEIIGIMKRYPSPF
ncbi:aldo/keto reductase [Saccharobesus litoralis]|uniref:Aldo/keto reductase n=1 Tax=Saccharobesus litoralis TaxID=2172099 RepID=A0A2S0VTV2_9ALTE|nr:aldo/keto reductase [Saccharobesus litoralis]AWB67520.1 aldo/keto reductase [Saccharobesus litoralis]